MCTYPLNSIDCDVNNCEYNTGDCCEADTIEIGSDKICLTYMKEKPEEPCSKDDPCDDPDCPICNND